MINGICNNSQLKIPEVNILVREKKENKIKAKFKLSNNGISLSPQNGKLFHAIVLVMAI